MTGPQKLAAWLGQHDESAHAFARRAGLDPAQVYRLLAGSYVRISIDLAVTIENATDGSVECRDWVNP